MQIMQNVQTMQGIETMQIMQVMQEGGRGLRCGRCTAGRRCPSTGQRPAAATPCRASSPASPGQSSRLWSCSLLSVGGWMGCALGHAAPAGCRRARQSGRAYQSERRADGARKKRCAIPLTRSKELFQPDARSDLLLLGPGLRPGRCGRVGSPEGVGRGSRNPRPPPLAQRSARRSKLNSGRCSCLHPTTGRPYGPARPFERSFWKGNAQFSALLHDLHDLHDLHGFYILHDPAWSERFA